MSKRPKGPVRAALFLVAIYAGVPFIAGLLGAYDLRGPKIFISAHHEILYQIGYAVAGRGKPRVPFMQERSWFYGVQGERKSETQILESLD